ncbi:uncharacterized protein OCT59_020890 [Rhizophagus irregularis]|uniref:uncharacterized protein n=1 Tax=Rhizophagus irregularis TaxID=588596 RepID=UPI0033261CCF|nr:hypothetical protein OCT59_020890 [Rhizophagus irregularis]
MFLNHPTQTIVNKRKRKCDECKKIRNIYENRQTCQMCYNITTLVKPKSSGNKVIDDFITHTQRNYIRSDGKLEFVPHDRFKDIEFIAEGGFSKIYKATWVDGPINWHGIERENWSFFRLKYNNTVVLKNLNNSKNITPKELNELKLFYRIFSNRKINASYVSTYLGLTQDPITKDIMIIMPYYNRGDLIRFLSNNFYNLDWNYKLLKLSTILLGLQNPNKRPEATDIYNRINRINGYNCEIKKSSEIGPVTTNNPGAIYKSRPLSDMIQSAMSTRSLRSQFITAEVGIKRKFEDNQTKTRFDEEKINKKIRLIENESNVYIKQEFELDIDINSIDDERYISQEIDFDI